MAWMFMLNPPATKKASKRRGVRVGTRKRTRKATKGMVPEGRKGGFMAKRRRTGTKRAPGTARARAYRALVKRTGSVTKAAKLWRTMRSKPSYAANAGKKRSRKRYARNAWAGDTASHRISALAGVARRKHIPAPLYLSKKGVQGYAIRKYAKRHGAIGSHKRASTRTYPASGLFASNPVKGAVAVVKGQASKEGLKDIATAAGGIFGAVIGAALLKKIAKDKADQFLIAGEIGGSLLVGVGIGIATKNFRRGALAASVGIGFSIFKLIYNKAIAGKGFMGLEFPAMGDYVEFPSTGDYVEFPSGVGGSLYTGADGIGVIPFQTVSSQPAAFMPEQFGEYSVGLGEEAEVEY